MKRTLALILALVMCIGMLPGITLAAEIPFTDVPTWQWYYSDVKNAYENGIINGKSATKFAPDDYMTYAEAAKLAACMFQRYTTGMVTLQNGNPWYQTYVDYAKFNGIVSKDYPWAQNATRAGYMEIFANALPDSALAEINFIADGSIPDVPVFHPQAAAIYKLYRAGILQGSDAIHSCNPAANIKRSEVAAILTRMMDSSKRIQFTMGTPPTSAALAITQQPQSVKDVVAGQTIAFTVAVTGGKTPYTYSWQWKNNATDWQIDFDSTSATLQKTLNAAQLASGMQFRCVIYDASGANVVSNAATVTAKAAAAAPLTITQQPESVSNVTAGQAIAFTVAVTGGKAPYTYTWQWKNAATDWQTDTSSTAATLTKVLNDTQLASGMQFRCVIKDAAGASVVSDPAAVTKSPILTRQLTITQQPQDLTAEIGKPVTFSIAVAGGKPPYTYQWQTYHVSNRWINHENGNNSTFSIEGVSPATIKYRCIVTDAAGTELTSNEVTFTITKPAPAAFTITQQPQDRIANEGDTVTFSVTVAGGTAPYTYAWEGYNGRWPLIGSESTVTVTAGISQDAITKVRCIITDSNGNIVGSRTATLTVLEGLKCTGTSKNDQIKVGTMGTFTASFSGGTAPYTYEWVVDGSTKGLKALTATTSQSDLGNSSTVSITPIAPKVYNSKEYFLMKCVCTDANGNKAESRVIQVSAYN